MKDVPRSPIGLEPPPPDSPNQGVKSNLSWRRESNGLFPTVLLNPGDFLFRRVIRRGEEYLVEDLVIVTKQQRVDALLDDTGQRREETTGEGDVFTGVMYDSKPMWKRTLNTSPKKRG